MEKKIFAMALTASHHLDLSSGVFKEEEHDKKILDNSYCV